MIVVEFKSDPINFENESQGYKPNTVREVDIGDERFKSLRRGEPVRIVIVDSQSGSWFMRTITDITHWTTSSGIRLVVISWEHEEMKTQYDPDFDKKWLKDKRVGK